MALVCDRAHADVASDNSAAADALAVVAVVVVLPSPDSAAAHSAFASTGAE